MWPRSLRSGDIILGVQKERNVFAIGGRQPQRSDRGKVFAWAGWMPITWLKFWLCGERWHLPPQGQVILFKSEKGSLVLFTPDNLVRKPFHQTPVKFTGKGTNSASGKIRATRGKATPSADERGAVTIAVSTIDGDKVFNTFYRLGK
jgi:hypothetical protein